MAWKINLSRFCLSTFLIIALAAAAVVPVASAAETKEEKFYLVYLVSVVDLKPGAKAFVDPMFFTDGSQIRNFFDYCRAHLKLEGSRTDLTAERIGENIKPLHKYCENQSIALPGEKYYTLNNAGLTVGLGPIVFSPGASSPGFEDGRYVMPSPFPYPGIVSVRSVEGEPLPIKLNTESVNRPRHFFLMSANRAILERLVPVQRFKSDEMAALVERAQRYANEAKGVRRGWRHKFLAGRPVVEFIQGIRSPGFENSEAKVIDALFADLDGDLSVDMVSGMTAQSERNGGSRWGGLGFLLSKTDPNFFANLQAPANYEVFLSYGYVVHAPFALIRTGKCTYVLSMLTEWGESYQLMSQPQETATCPYRNLTRWESHP